MEQGNSLVAERVLNVKYPYTRSYRDRHGKLRVEYRRNGRTIPIHAEPGTAEFQAAYDNARAVFEDLGMIGSSPRAPSAPATGSLRWLCIEYFRSAEFEQLAPSTQRARRQVLEGMLKEPIQGRFFCSQIFR